MATDFMAHQAQYLNKWVACCILTLVALACKNPVEQVHESKKYLYINAATATLQNSNGRLLLHQLPFTGAIFELYKNGDTAFVKNYNLGYEHGVHKTFYTNNILQEQRFFNTGIKTDTLKKWWPNKQLQWLYIFKNGEYNGVCYEWNSNGLLVKKMTYENGYEQGMQTHYYDNGIVKSNYKIINGRRYGLLGTKNCVNVSIPFIKK